jgi:hypothetical protein
MRYQMEYLTGKLSFAAGNVFIPRLATRGVICSVSVRGRIRNASGAGIITAQIN